MEETVVSAVFGKILDTVTNFLSNKIQLYLGLEDELEGLKSTITDLRCYLEDAEIKQRNNKRMQIWLRKLKHAVYDAEHVLDDVEIESHKREEEAAEGNLRKRPKLLFSTYKMAHKVKSVREKLSVIAAERVQFNLEQGVAGNFQFGTALEGRETMSLVNEDKVYGRTEEKEMIVEKLLGNGRAQDDLSIFAICGMGGLGKTTLAQLIYNDQRIEGHFDSRIWLSVSDDFDVIRLVKGMIESIDGDARKIHGMDTLEALQRHLREGLRAKRFLLILDDIWNENEMLWDQLKEILRCDSKGSVLVITTRSKIVASMMENIGVHFIERLTKGDSWALFEQKASSTGKVDDNLVAIGKAIVEKCCGVPLAVKAIGSLM